MKSSNLPVQKKTKTGYATDVETLNELAPLHPLPEQVLAYRSIAKLKSTYIDKMPDLVTRPRAASTPPIIRL